MLRPRFALLALFVSMCCAVFATAGAAHAQLIIPLPLTPETDSFLTAVASPQIHTCALPPGFEEAERNPWQLIKDATSRLSSRIESSANEAWLALSSLGDNSGWRVRAMKDRVTTARFKTASARLPERASSPEICPLACLLDDPARATIYPARATTSAARATARSSTDDVGQDSSKLQSATDQLAEIGPIASVFLPPFDLPFVVEPRAFTLESINRTRRASVAANATTDRSSQVLENLATFQAVCAVMANSDLTDEGRWFSEQLGTAQAWLANSLVDATFLHLAIDEPSLAAPPQSDPGMPGVRQRLSRAVVTPYGPVVLSRAPRASDQSRFASNPLRNQTSDRILSKTIALLKQLLPVRSWLANAQSAGEEGWNRGIDLVAELVAQAGTSDSLPELPEVTRPEIARPQVRPAGAIRETDEAASIFDMPQFDESLLPLDPAWLDYECPLEKAAKEFGTESSSNTTRTETTKHVPAQTLGNLVTLLKDASLDAATKIGEALNQTQDGIADSQPTTPANRDRASMANRNMRFGLAVGYSAQGRVQQRGTLLNLEQLEMVNEAGRRLGLATSRVSLGFQEAVSILLDAQEPAAAAVRTADHQSGEDPSQAR